MASSEALPENSGEKDGRALTRTGFFLIILELCLAVFLVAIDNTIVATAIPRIADEFGALDKVGWYRAAYIMTMCATQLPFGKLYSLYPVKAVFLGSILVFEFGSVLCGAASTSNGFIAGRAVAGVGGAGVFQGSMVVVSYIVPVRERPTYNGIFGAMFGVRSILGPLLGGVFVDRVSWRWCFYINLPIGAVTIAVVVILLRISGQVRLKGGPWTERLDRMDPLGNLLFLPAVLSLLLALQWGGSDYAWNSATIIIMFVLATVLSSLFIVVQVRRGENATVPLRVARSRSTVSAALFSLCIVSAYLGLIFYLPVWFQAIQQVSAVQSGLRCLPLMLSVVVFSIISGVGVRMLNRYPPLALASSILTALGSGLMTIFAVDAPASQWIGYQVIFGAGVGLGVQLGIVAVQTRLDTKDIAVGIAIVSFFQYLGGTLCLAVYQAVFKNRFLAQLADLAPGIVTVVQQGIGATDWRQAVDPQHYDAFRSAFHESLKNCWFISVGLASTSVVGAFAMEWGSIEQPESTPTVTAKEEDPERNA